jgi:hypothetical protein
VRVFDPWIGKLYWDEGLLGVRVLVLGESHYGIPGEEYAEFTQGVVCEWAIEKRFAFFTKTAKLALGRGAGERVSDKERADFWGRVAFYNYVQSFLPAARYRPTLNMWEAAGQPFLRLLEELSPKVVLVLGAELRSHLPELPTSISVCYVTHPSSSKFTYELAIPEFQKAFKRAKGTLE